MTTPDGSAEATQAADQYERIAPDRLRVRQQALAALAGAETFRQGDRRGALREITETAARALEVERVGIWLWDGSDPVIRCADLWDASTREHTTDGELRRSDASPYFESLESQRAIIVHDAVADPRTVTLAAEYLTPHGIGALLDAPIRAGGRLIGMVRHEHVGGARRWLPEDEQFAASIADLAALAIEASERVRMAEALRAAEAGYRTLVDRALVGIYRATVDGRFLAVNPALVSMLGYDSIEEVLDLHLAVDVWADAGARAQMIAVHQPAERIEGVEATWKKRDGAPLTVRLFGRPLLDSEGRVFGFETTVEDITERRALEAQLRQAQKMEAVGQLSGGIAHDFNNILTVIMATADLIRHSLDDTQRELLADVTELQEAARRGTELVTHLLGFSRQTKIAQRPIELGAVVHPLSKTLQRLLPESIEVRVITPDTGPVVCVDPGTIEQMVLNAATNARDAMPEGGVLTIEARDTWIDEEHRARHGWGEPGQYGSIIVSDTGKGMDQPTLDRAFEPFFTTKPTGLGTGLGMAMIYGLVKQQNGFVDLGSAPGRGTTLRIYFPVVDDPALPVARIDTNATDEFTPATVMLVEDEPAVANVTTRVLEHAGYRVLLVENGLEAIACFDRHATDISLIITDMVMPEMGGRELYETLRNRAPEAQFLFVSGYAAERAALDPDVAFLHKPWTVTDLLRTVQYLIGACAA